MSESLEAKRIALEQVEKILADTLDNADVLDKKCAFSLLGVGGILLGTIAYIPYLATSVFSSHSTSVKWLMFATLTVFFIGGVIVLGVLLKAYSTRKYELNGHPMTNWDNENRPYHSVEGLLDFLRGQCQHRVTANASTNARRGSCINLALIAAIAVLALTALGALICLALVLL